MFLKLNTKKSQGKLQRFLSFTSMGSSEENLQLKPEKTRDAFLLAESQGFEKGEKTCVEIFVVFRDILIKNCLVH